MYIITFLSKNYTLYVSKLCRAIAVYNVSNMYFILHEGNVALERNPRPGYDTLPYPTIASRKSFKYIPV